MKPIRMDNSTGLDRMATWTEARFAMCVMSQGTLPPKSACDEFTEVDSDIKDRPPNLSKGVVWLAIVNGMLDSKSN